MHTYSGGTTVKASSLNVGEYIRDPRKRGRIMIVVDVGSYQIQVKGLDIADVDKHRFINKDTLVERVTNCTTETSSTPGPNEGVI